MAPDFVNLTKYNVFLKLMIDGLSGRPFSAETLAPFPLPEKTNKEKIIKVSRERYASPRQIIEDKITEHLKSYTFLKFIFVSALTKQRIHKVMEEAKIIFEERNKSIKTSQLNQILLEEIKRMVSKNIYGYGDQVKDFLMQNEILEKDTQKDV